MKYFVVIIIIGTIACASHKMSSNKLLKISNIEDFFYQDYSDNLNYKVMLIDTLSHKKKVKSMAIYRYSSTYEKFLFADSLIFNKNKQVIVSFTPYEDNHRFYHTYFFYDNKGNRYVDIKTDHYNQDSIYTFYKFDKFNRMYQKIRYNSTRKEYEKIIITKINPTSDSTLNIQYENYDTDWKQHFLPYETRNIDLQKKSDSILKISTDRILQNDTNYNSSYSDVYKIKNNTLIRTNEKTDNNIYKFYFYTTHDNEISRNVSINQSIVTMLHRNIDSLVTDAWKRYNENIRSLAKRTQVLEAGVGIDSIELKESFKLKDFLPKLWYVVCQDSGKLNGFNGQCYVVGYNTPLKNNDGYNIRCLAIYEKVNEKYILKKQSYGALEDFIDENQDLLFDTNSSEINFFISLSDGDITINYDYMRGQADYTFSYENKNWVLVNYYSTHRTCCEAEVYSYNYKTKEYHASISATSEDDSRDTSITIIEERPIVYMDSINIRSFDYNETGLLIK